MTTTWNQEISDLRERARHVTLTGEAPQMGARTAAQCLSGVKSAWCPVVGPWTSCSASAPTWRGRTGPG